MYRQENKNLRRAKPSNFSRIIFFYFSIQKMESAFRTVTPQEALDLQGMFPDIAVDFTQFKVISDNYTQSTKTSCDTLTDTRCEFYIPPKATLIKHWMIEADVKLIKSDGSDAAIDIASGATALATISQTLDSAPSCIE